MGKVFGKKRITTEVVTAIDCDCCGKSCLKQLESEYAMFHANWGYETQGLDGQNWECYLCEDCAIAVKNFIEASGGKVTLSEY